MTEFNSLIFSLKVFSEIDDAMEIAQEISGREFDIQLSLALMDQNLQNFVFLGRSFSLSMYLHCGKSFVLFSASILSPVNLKLFVLWSLVSNRSFVAEVEKLLNSFVAVLTMSSTGEPDRPISFCSIL